MITPAGRLSAVHDPHQPGADGKQHQRQQDGQQSDSPVVERVWIPAPFSDAILRFVANAGLLPHAGTIIDPFAGIGRVHRLASASLRTVGVEIEPEWARCHKNTVCGNALALPFEDASFDGAVTSPVYGNRMSDAHHAQDGSVRRSYTHDLRRTTGDSERRLHPDNSGTLYAWQPEYWRFHVRAWAELHRVLRPGAPALINVSDFLRTRRGKQQRIPVALMHARVFVKLGFDFIDAYPVETPRMRRGENHEARVECEHILHFRR